MYSEPLSWGVLNVSHRDSSLEAEVAEAETTMRKKQRDADSEELQYSSSLGNRCLLMRG